MKKIFIPFIAFSLLAGSCSKELNLTPSDQIDISKAFTSVEDLEKGLLGVYAANGKTNKVYIGSILADEAKISSENRGQGQFTFKWQFSAAQGEHNSAFGQYYVMMDRLHRVLEAIDLVTTGDNTKKAKIRAELIGLRGVALYESLIHFMPPGYDPNALGIAIMLKSDIAAKPARNKVGEVLTQIEADLATARASADIPNAPTDVLRLSKATIAAYQARVALLKKDWAAANTYATDAITLSGKTLATGSTYTSYWSDVNESETLWKYRNSSTPQLLWRDVNGDVFFEPSDKLKSQFNRTADIRFNAFFGAASGDTSIVKKYPGSPLGPQINDLKIVRLSELYLLRAEANAELNQLTQASADLNAVRTARITGYTNITLATKDEAIIAILNERFKELCFEGFRFFDLKRRNLPVLRNASDVGSTTWQTLAAGDFRFTLPIPQEEIFANPNAQQNPGY